MMDPTPYLHIPYAVGGRDWSGCDCWGLVRLVYAREYAIDLPVFGDAGDYPASWAERMARPDARAGWTAILDPCEGDVLLMRMAGFPCHCAVWVGEGDYMLHSLKTFSWSGVSRMGSILWPWSRVAGIFRHEARAC